MKKTLGRVFITLKQLETIIVEIEAMLNDRPLTYVSPDLSDPAPLTPSHLLYGRRIRPVPQPLDDVEELDDPSYSDGNDIRRKVDKRTQLIQQFWIRWKREYLTSLREFNKVSGYNKQVIRIGDVVIVHDDKPRIQWRLAVIEKLITGRDNLVRAAHIRMGNYKTIRSIVKLYPLEVRSEDEGNLHTTDDNVQHLQDPQPTSDDTSTTSSSVRVRRNAASKALQKMSEWTTMLCRAPEDVGN